MADENAAVPLPRRQFASDNYAGICPEAFEAMAAANRGHACSYGDDAWTRRACDLIRELFETDCDVFFTFTGTAANSLAIATMCKPYQSVICQEFAHIETDECGAPEFFANGSKILLVRGEAGKVDLDAVEQTVRRRTDIHYPRPRVLSLTQATELGTVYSVEELQEAGRRAKSLNLRVHMDGARLANSLVTLGCAPKEVTWQAGVDVLCLGGSKNGIGFGEAVVFFDRELAAEFDYRCKQAGQLASKMRFIAAPWAGMLQSGAWLARAAHANHCARLLAERLQVIKGLSQNPCGTGVSPVDFRGFGIGSKGIKLMFPCQANSVFVRMPPALIEGLHARGWHFYTFIGCGGARLMCSWDTTEDDIDALVTDVRALAAGTPQR